MSRKTTLDLNADMGDGFSALTIGAGVDAQIMLLISLANVATSFHAGDPKIVDAQSLATAINSATVTSSAVAILKRCITPRFCPPRSTELIYERSMPARWASSSWDRPCLSRTSRIALPS